jgi:predicted ABC-type ATPase
MSVANEARDATGKWTSGEEGAKAIVGSLGGTGDDEARANLGAGEATDTKALHIDSAGRYSQGRKAVHEAIINHFLKGSKPQAQPQAIFTAGGAASGKSGMAGQARDAEANIQTPKGHVYINPDDIKAMLPEYGALQKSGRSDVAAASAHEESSDIAKALTAVAMKLRRHIIVDGTGDSNVGKFGQKLRAASDAGYKVEARYAHIPADEAVKREKLRAERTGRKVDESVLRGQHQTVSASYVSDVQNIPNEVSPVTGRQRDVSVKIYSTASRGRPVLIAHQPAGKPNRVLNAKKFQEHIVKAAS